VALPSAAWVEIHVEDGLFRAIRYSRIGEFAGDTVHQSLLEAQQQAEFEFAISKADWVATDA
jgi:hypothetical protein